MKADNRVKWAVVALLVVATSGVSACGQEEEPTPRYVRYVGSDYFGLSGEEYEAIDRAAKVECDQDPNCASGVLNAKFIHPDDRKFAAEQGVAGIDPDQIAALNSLHEGEPGLKTAYLGGYLREVSKYGP